MPAKPRKFYLAQLAGIADAVSLKKKLAGRFIGHGDARITKAAAAYALQALFFSVTDGEAFCDDKDFLFYNAHWQEELVYMLERLELCAHHRIIANKFNKAQSNRGSFQQPHAACSIFDY